MTRLVLLNALPQCWRVPVLSLTAAIAVIALVTAGEWGEMLHQWWNIDTYSHILLVPLIIAWLVALKLDELAKINPRAFAPGLVLVVLAFGLLFTGRALGINLFAHAGAVGALQAAIVTILGLRATTLLFLPVAFGVFLVPFGDEIIAPLQTITAEIAILITQLSGVDAVIDGIYIDTPAGLFVVAEACSGVRFLIAMVTLAVLVCFTRFNSWTKRISFLSASIIVPIFANGIRAWGTIYIAQFYGIEFAEGFDHVVYGWFFFAFVVVVLLAIAWPFFEREPEDYGWTVEESKERGLLRHLDRFGTATGTAGVAVMALAVLGSVVVSAFLPTTFG
ncbi:MAG: exosortase A [Pseudomonadota bacterium]